MLLKTKIICITCLEKQTKYEIIKLVYKKTGVKISKKKTYIGYNETRLQENRCKN